MLGADGCGSDGLAETGIGAGVCCGIVARDDGTSSSAWPRVMIVNSARTPSKRYSSCKGLQGRVNRAVTVAFAVSACPTTALKSLRLIATCILSSTMYSWKSSLSVATDVCTGCFKTSILVLACQGFGFECRDVHAFAFGDLRGETCKHCPAGIRVHIQLFSR